MMAILEEKDGNDSELLVYAMTLINKVNYTPGTVPKYWRNISNINLWVIRQNRVFIFVMVMDIKSQ